MHLNAEWLKEKKYMIHIQLINREANHLRAVYCAPITAFTVMRIGWPFLIRVLRLKQRVL